MARLACQVFQEREGIPAPRDPLAERATSGTRAGLASWETGEREVPKVRRGAAPVPLRFAVRVPSGRRGVHSAKRSGAGLQPGPSPPVGSVVLVLDLQTKLTFLTSQSHHIK